jgi:hypothetical protein
LQYGKQYSNQKRITRGREKGEYTKIVKGQQMQQNNKKAKRNAKQQPNKYIYVGTYISHTEFSHSHSGSRKLYPSDFFSLHSSTKCNPTFCSREMTTQAETMAGKE